METCVALLTAWISLRLRRDRALAAVRTGAFATELAASPPATATKLRWALGAVERRIPPARNCLIKALAARTLLQRRGFASRIVLGVRRGADGHFMAHTWVEDSAGRCVVGGDGPAAYTPLTRARGGAS